MLAPMPKKLKLMAFLNRITWIGLIIIFGGCHQQNAIPIEADVIIRRVNIVDVLNGKIVPNQYVVVKGRLITGIYNYPVTPKSHGREIDGNGKFLIPGLWDMHAHYSINHSFSSLLLVANGVTGIREMWGWMDTVRMIRKRIAIDSSIIPDIYSAGSIIDGDPPARPRFTSVRNGEEARAEALKQIDQGVDFFKIYGNLTKESYYSIVEISREYGVPFVGHVPIRLNIWETIAAGQASIEHQEGLLEACTSKPQELKSSFPRFQVFTDEALEFLLESFNSPKFDSLVEILARSETWWSPTLTVLYSEAYSRDARHSEDSLFQYMPQHIQEWWMGSLGQPNYIRRKRFQFLQTLIGKMERRGVKILAGTDFPNPFCYPGFSLHDELNLLVQGGLSTSAALKTATLNPAIFMRKENELGLIKQNHLASMVLLKSDPLKDINNIRDIDGVFLRGQYLSRAALDSLLRSAKSIATNMQSPF